MWISLQMDIDKSHRVNFYYPAAYLNQYSRKHITTEGSLSSFKHPILLSHSKCNFHASRYEIRFYGRDRKSIWKLNKSLVLLATANWSLFAMR